MVTKPEEFLKVGQEITIYYKGFSFSVIVANTEENKILVMGNKKPYGDISTGEFLEIRANQEDDGLYYLNALSLEIVYRGKVFFLLLRGINEPVRYQRRDSKRIPVFLKANFIPVNDRKFWEGMIFDLSEKGMLLAAREPLSIGSEAYVSFEEVSEKGRCLVGVMGKVVRRHVPETEEELKCWNFFYGIAFLSPPQKSEVSSLP